MGPAIRSFGLARQGSAHARMEDAILVDDGLGLYAVADGVTRPGGGAEASGVAVQGLSRAYQEERDLVRAFRRAHGDVLRERKLRARDLFVGFSTLTAVAVEGRGYRLVHAGDSAAILCREGRASVLTVEHHDEWGALTQCAGMEGEFEPFSAAGDLRPGDHLILATDGITRCVDADSVAEAAARHGDPERVARRLVDAASAAAPAYDDDKSVVVLHFPRS